jgi:alpha-L-fucosidase
MNMNKTIIHLAVAVSALMMSSPAQAGAAARDFSRETPSQRDRRMEWWREARFGMFIHWGLYAIPAGEWKGRKDHAEWIRTTAQIPFEEYNRFVPQFNPTNFDAARWAQLARRAGMKYLVITSKHHDGFCLWDSKLTDFDVASTPFKRDILKELSVACKKEDVRFCTYHSIMDWHHPDYLPRRDWEKQRSTEGADFNRFRRYLEGQLAELVDNVNPGVLWFDGEWEDTWMHEMGKDLYDYVRGLNPRIIINNRVDKGRRGMQGMTAEGEFRGDFGTPEQEIPPQGLPGVDWESCMTMNRYWGWNQADTQWKSTEDLVRKLVDIASKGGNFLLNIGPKPDGNFPELAVERLEGIGRWMDVNSEAIYGTSASPFKRLPWGRCTQKSSGKRTMLYLHVFNWPADGLLVVPGLKTKADKAWLLADKKRKPLATTSAGGDLAIAVPIAVPDAISSTVVVQLTGVPEVDQAGLAQSADGSVTLPASEATTHGELKYESGEHRDNLGFWTNPVDWAAWDFKVTKPGKVEVVAEVASLGTASVEVRLGKQRARAPVPATGDYGRFQPVKLGTLDLTVGKNVSLSLHAVKDGWQPVNVKRLKLLPLQ